MHSRAASTTQKHRLRINFVDDASEMTKLDPLHEKRAAFLFISVDLDIHDKPQHQTQFQFVDTARYDRALEL